MAKHKKILLVLLLLFLTTSYVLGYSPILLSVIIIFASLITYVAYAKDKSAASKGTWRVPEKTLHLLALFFGWPGALIAQERLRHKTKKLGFRLIFWLTVLLNMAVMYFIHTPSGSEAVRYSVSKIQQLIVSEVHSESSREMLLLLARLEKH